MRRSGEEGCRLDTHGSGFSFLLNSIFLAGRLKRRGKFTFFGEGGMIFLKRSKPWGAGGHPALGAAPW